MCGFHCTPFNQKIKEKKKNPADIGWNISIKAETNMIVANYY
jgi:hypothetical protein